MPILSAPDYLPKSLYKKSDNFELPTKYGKTLICVLANKRFYFRGFRRKFCVCIRLGIPRSAF